MISLLALLPGAVAPVCCNGATGPVDLPPPPPPATEIDLAPAQLTASSDSARNGGALSVNLTLNNLQPGNVSTTFDVVFHLALSTAFNPASDTMVGTATVPAGASPAGNSSSPVGAALSIPAGTLNQDVYLYAVVDPAGQLKETDTSNNTSSPGNAAKVLMWDSIHLETCAPSGSGIVNTALALYDGTGAFLQSVNDVTQNGCAFIDRTSVSLAPGTYYVLVTSWADGPYVMALRPPAISRKNFTPLVSKAEDPYRVNDNPHLYPFNVTLPFVPPVPVVSMTVGSMVNRYAVNNSDDWFTFALP